MHNPIIECVESSDTYGRFITEPLERGFGITLGNALRRVLLSSLPGAAVTWVKIEGVTHEFSTIPHMKEDTIDFLLNVRALRLRTLSDQPGKLTLEVTGEGQVCAADIKPSADFEVANPELHLATLDSPEARLFVEFNVEQGKGYVPAGHSNGLPIGATPVDAIFTPVRKVNYTIEPTRIGQETNYERLILEAWTDGTISAVEAVSKSADILIEQFSLFSDLAKAPQVSAEEQLVPLPYPDETYNMPIEQLDLPTRIFHSLKRSGITTVGELLKKSDKELLALRSFGQKSMEELQERLKALESTATPQIEEEAKDLIMAEAKSPAEETQEESQAEEKSEAE